MSFKPSPQAGLSAKQVEITIIMFAELPQSDYTIIHLPAKSTDWAAILAQFTLAISAREGRLYASWVSERLSRAIGVADGVVAISEKGTLLGLMLFEITGNTAEISLPWTKSPDDSLMNDLAKAVLTVLRSDHLDLKYYRAERQLLPGDMPIGGLEAAGFSCHWRVRMSLELSNWRGKTATPDEVGLIPWNIAFLDEVAEVVYRANKDTLDAKLYAPFFGESPQQCRKGLLAILAGRYGPVNQQATLCALHKEKVVGINLVANDEGGFANIVEISVDPAYQGRGIGRALMAKSLTTLKEASFERVELAVTAANRGAMLLYQSLGFQEIGNFPVCYWPTINPAKSFSINGE